MTDVISAGNPSAAPFSQPRTARFGVFELDLRSGELRRDGLRVPLQEQPFRLLAFLIARPGEVISRDELHEQLWPSEFVDFDHGLNTAIRKLRTALDDSADNPRFIETLARRGYRFIAPVSWDSVTAAPAPVETLPRRTWLLIIAAVLLAGTIAATFILRRPQASAAPSIGAVAVLPFTNDHPQTAHLSDGLTEELIDALSRQPSMRVMARTTVFRYKGQTVDPQTVGRDLDVGAVVLGNVRRDGDAYRVRVELIDVRDGSQLWGDHFRVSGGELPGLQNRIADLLFNRLRYGKRVPGAQTQNAEAYQLYLKGLYAWNERGVDDLRRSIELFTRAAVLDPTYAAPHAGIANAWGVMTGHGIISPEEGTPRVMAAAKRALELDPANAEAYTSMATTKFRNMWDFAGAEADYRHALRLNPNYATGHQWYSDFLRSMGRMAEARQEIDTAYKLDPFAPAITGARCWSYFFEERYAEGIAFARSAAKADARCAAPTCIVRSMLVMGDFEEMFREMRKLGMPLSEVAELESAFQAGGREGLYRKRLERFMAGEKPESTHPVEIAATWAALGNKDEAFRWLDIAARHRVSKVTTVNVDPELKALRDDPRFDALLKRIGLPKVASS
ncbi:MAG TPA: winged helix-turn-helix domain-containing protein [Thermoanaerobaculia bacterium]|nr:winged helix-turn-helix domain-containing protein [Thermoanaerobaculia bacterium]